MSRHDVTKAGYFYNGGLWGNYLSFVGSSWNFVSSRIKKRWHTSRMFQLEKTSNKKVIAKKPLTSLYEMNSRTQNGFPEKVLCIILKIVILFNILIIQVYRARGQQVEATLWNLAPCSRTVLKFEQAIWSHLKSETDSLLNWVWELS